jgi:Flp pilus assembly protein TadD
MPWSSDPWRLQGEAQYVQGNFDAARANFRKAIDKDPNNWLLWADLATVGTHGTWRAPARRALALNPLAPELAEFRKALGGKG